MRALVYEVPGNPVLWNKPIPVILFPTDAIVRISKTTICGTDLDILKGKVPTCLPGTTLGHEGIGVIDSVGSAVTGFHPGDGVLISCISSCGRCEYCQRGMSSHCVDGGWILGHKIDGTQAEYVRIPFADTSLYRIPPDVDEDSLVMLSEILPTGFECGVLNGNIQPGSSVAIVGAGPVGLAALMTAQFFAPSSIIMVEVDPHRLEVSRQFAASHTVRAVERAAVIAVLELTGGRGVDTAIEAVGTPATFKLCTDIIAPGGTVANVGVHYRPADLHLEQLWSKNITITTRLVDTTTIPQLLKAVQSGRLDVSGLITHRFMLKDIVDAYALFADALSARVLKVIIAANHVC
jgi:alcohol dehydrogenase